jgi:predicted NAD-dependent protein-ADP-ribosyltransferase YbiA (DUF1768 family)
VIGVRDAGPARGLRIVLGLLAAVATVHAACLAAPAAVHQARAAERLAARARYPSHWWTAVSAEGAPSWEILPQAAGPGEVIVSKRHELGLLSNFAATPFVFRGRRYASLEGFWQMMLYPEGPDDPRARFAGLEWPVRRDQVAAMTGFEAKAAGTSAEANMARMGIDWVSFEGRRFPYRPQQAGEHYRLIVAATQAKVSQNPDVRKVLLATGDLVLRPDHHEEPGAVAAWHYCDILMAIRAQLQQEGRRQFVLLRPNSSEADLGPPNMSGDDGRLARTRCAVGWSREARDGRRPERPEPAPTELHSIGSTLAVQDV